MTTLSSFVNAIGKALFATANALIDYASREPVRTVGVIRSGLMLLLAFWPGLVSPPQSEAIIGFAVVLLGVDQAVRSQVTPA